MTEIKYCALPECNKPFTNWRSSCCCPTHQKVYAGRRAHGRSEKVYEKPCYVRKTPILTDEEKRIKRKINRITRKKIKSKSMSIWANKDKMREIYEEAERLTSETGIAHEVDHIIPTINPLVCGLHNEFNLQILTLSANRKKNNKFEII